MTCYDNIDEICGIREITISATGGVEAFPGHGVTMELGDYAENMDLDDAAMAVLNARLDAGETVVMEANTDTEHKVWLA